MSEKVVDELYDEIDRLVAEVASYLPPTAENADVALAMLRSLARTEVGVSQTAAQVYDAHLVKQAKTLEQMYEQRQEMVDEIDRLQAQVSTLMRLGREHFPDKLV